MIKSLCLIFLLFTTLSFAQRPDYDFAKAEKETRRLIYSYPDSALLIIKRTLAQKGSFHDTIYGNTYNLYGMYFGMKGQPDSTIYYIKKSLTYLDGYPKNKVRSLMNLAIGYRNKSDYKTSIEYLSKSIELNKKQKNEVGVAMAYGELASNYNYMLDYNKSVDYLVKSIAILKAEKNTRQLPAVKQKLANTYMAMGNLKFAIDLYKECLPEFKAIGMLKNYYLTQVNLGDALLTSKQYSEAEKVLNEALSGLANYGDKEMLGICYSKIGALNFRQGHTTKAAATFKKAFDNLQYTKSYWLTGIAGMYIEALNKLQNYPEAMAVIKKIDAMKIFNRANKEDQVKYKNAVADTYNATNNDKEAIKAYQHTIDIMDSIATDKQQEAIREVQAKFQTELQREKNLALEANNNALQKNIEIEKKLNAFYIFGVVALTILIIVVSRSYWLHDKLQKEQLKTAEADKVLLQQQHRHEEELINAQKEIIEEKQRELTSTALRMASYQDNINNIIESKITDADELKKELIQLSRQQDYWKQFETRFNSLHPDFAHSLTLQFPKLTKNDIEFCSLLKLNLSNKEIAALLQISHESAITKKYRIKKKMEFNDDSEFEKLLMAI
ncbi:tetratricopeptide repeat protein [Flavobacterium zepuense]|uniref:Tetratricopeptide repeat protein n=1 Tax=Flavobacterium zepuense TaxID=2593302 RepID=A0A552UXD5_9FLAO|nr:tetratricopeptide repeat protein [Flavobacterium zepuense]TRW22869.1 tetratricopeptide repeat protein [Flavobacterium zepuense]